MSPEDRETGLTDHPAAPSVLEVLDGGLLTTIQDLGRFQHLHEGVPRAGAADGLSFRLANLLLGNPEGAAGLESTILGPRLRALTRLRIGLAGADLGARRRRNDAVEPLPPGRTHELEPGDLVEFEGRPDGGLGCRAYLAVPGGFDVPEVLGSRSTSLVGGFGGLDGRAVRSGDGLRAASGGTAAAGLVPAGVALPSPAQRLRVASAAAAEGGLDRPWVVANDSDRRGLRLTPAAYGAGQRAGADQPAGADRGSSAAAADGPSQGVVPGTIQLTPSGQPLVLMPDGGTTGGYPVLGVVIEADLPILGQLAPGDEVRFRRIDLAAARAAAIERRELLERLRSALAGGA